MEEQRTRFFSISEAVYKVPADMSIAVFSSGGRGVVEEEDEKEERARRRDLMRFDQINKFSFFIDRIIT